MTHMELHTDALGDISFDELTEILSAPPGLQNRAVTFFLGDFIVRTQNYVTQVVPRRH